MFGNVAWASRVCVRLRSQRGAGVEELSDILFLAALAWTFGKAGSLRRS